MSDHAVDQTSAPGGVRMVKFLMLVLFWTAFGTLCLIFLAGCATTDRTDPMMGKSYEPGNIYRPVERLPENVRTVAVLPLTNDSADYDADTGRAQFQSVLLAELARKETFEIAVVSPEQLQVWTGKKYWRADEVLPRDFIEKIRKGSGCEAVLFSRVTHYTAYPPLVLGWSMKLVDAASPTVWWAADVLYNAGEPPVALAARRYHKDHYEYNPALADSHTALNSPVRFAHYTLDSLFNTLPRR